MKTAIICGMQSEADIAAAWNVPVIIANNDDEEQLTAACEAAVAGGVQRMLSFGVAGALAPYLSGGDLVMANQVLDGGAFLRADPAWFVELANLSKPAASGTFCWAATPVDTVAEKVALYASTHAIAVDMETVVMARVCAAHNIPFAVLRAISDTAQMDLPAAAAVAVNPDGSINAWAIMKSLALNITQLPSLISLGITSQKAFANLKLAVKNIGAL